MLTPNRVPHPHAFALDNDEGVNGLIFFVLRKVVPDVLAVSLDNITVVIPRGVDIHRICPPDQRSRLKKQDCTTCAG